MSVRAPVGPVNIATQKVCIGRGLAAIRVSNKIERDFLFQFLVKTEREITGNAGAVFNSISKKQIESIYIPLPPLAEQKRIAAKLDAIFVHIDTLKRNTEKNLASTHELFTSYMHQLFAAGKKAGWEVKRLGEVCEVFAGQSPKGKYYNNTSDGVPFYQGKKEFTDKYIGDPSTWTTAVTKTAFKNDILMSVRAPVGPVNIATQKVCIGRGLAAIRVSNKIERDFLFQFLVKTEREITGNAGAVFNSISKKQIESIYIPLPPLAEQKQIASKLDTLQAKTNELKEIYQRKLTLLDELRRSILERAFVGEM